MGVRFESCGNRDLRGIIWGRFGLLVLVLVFEGKDGGAASGGGARMSGRGSRVLVPAATYPDMRALN